MAGFLFLSISKIAYADMPVQDPYGLYDPTGGVAAASDKAQNNPDSCIGLTWFKYPIICSLMAVFGFVSVLLEGAATLFGWIVQVGNMNALLNAGAGAGGTGGSVIYELWTMVRDLLNIAFILVLLFSAFATIFQVEKFNYKKLLLNLVLMALLVNFSYPIARFIIDVSNVLMYTLIRSVLTPAVGGDATKSFGILTQSTGFVNIITPAGASITYLLSAIVFTFLLAVTLLAVGVMFIIRMVALTILIIFSPIAFVGAILPGKAAGFAGQWWDNLFKYAFFGPIMIFIIYITVRIMDVMGKTDIIMTFVGAGKPNANDPNMAGTIAFFSIPIVLLWMGMSLGQKMGIAGAATVMGAAQKTAKWAGKKGSGYSWGKKQYDDYAAIKKKEKEDALKHKPHIIDRTLAKLGDPKAQERVAKKHKDKNQDDIDKGAKKLVDGGENTDTLAEKMNTHFGSPPPKDKHGKIEQATLAAAYIKQDADERRMHIQSTLQANGGLTDSDIEHIMSIGPPPEFTPGSSAYKNYINERFEAQASAAKIATKTGNDNDLRRVEAFVKNQMKRKVQTGTNAA